MADPFDEIRETTQRKINELNKKKQADEELRNKLEAQRNEALLKYSKELQTHAVQIIAILDEFRIACSGVDNPKFEKISFRSRDFTAITHLRVEMPVDIYKNRYLEIFFKIVGDESGSIKNYYLGTFRDISRGDYADDDRVYENTIKLSSSTNSKTIKDELLKLYKTIK